MNVEEELATGAPQPRLRRRISLAAYLPAIIVGIVFVGYAARLFRLISRHAVNIFFWDEWDINDATLFQHHSLWEIFTWQPGPQRQGLGGLLTKLIEPWFQWNSRTQSFVIGGIIVLTALLVLYLKARLYGRLTYLDVLVPIIYFTPRQYENIFVTANIARDSLPALLLIVYCLSWTIARARLRYFLVLALNFLCIYTGFGFFVGILTPALLYLDYRAEGDFSVRRRFWLGGCVVVALLSLGSFFIHYYNRPGLACFSWRLLSPRVYLRFMALMFANFFGMAISGRLARWVGIVVLVVLTGVLLRVVYRLATRRGIDPTNDRGKRNVVIGALIGFGLLFAANAAYGRACAGMFFAQSSRYVIFLEPAILGLYFFLLGVRRERMRMLAVVGLIVAALPASIRLQQEWFYFPQQKARWRSCYLRTESIQECDRETGFTIYPRPEATHLREKLQFLKQTHQNLYADTD